MADKYQAKGLGVKLVDLLIGVAKEKKVESGIIAENVTMIRLCEKLGFAIRRDKGELRLQQHQNLWTERNQRKHACILCAPHSKEYCSICA